MMYTIYKITNEMNKKFYIGFTTAEPSSKRWNAHIRLAASHRYNNIHFHNAIRKYGHSVFTFEILKQGVDCEWGRKVEEPFYIAMYRPEYNMTNGGDGTQGLRHSEEHNRKIGDALRGVKRGPQTTEHRNKISEANKDMFFSPEHKQKISESKSKNWCVISPTGEEFMVKNLEKLCHKYNLHIGNMSMVAKGKRNHCKGWTCRKLEHHS